MNLSSKQIATFLCGMMLSHAVVAQQASPNTSLSQANQLPLSGRTGQPGSVSAQQSAVPGTTQSVNTINSNLSVQGSYSQSALSGKPLAGKLSLRDAVAMGLEYNLGAIADNNAVLQAHGQMRVTRSTLLPNLNTSLREVVQQTDLATIGLHLPNVPTIIGPYNYFDLRGTLTQALVDLTAWNNYRASQANLTAQRMAAKDAQDLIVLAVGGTYLQVIAAQGRVDSSQAQVQTAKAVYEQTLERRKVGLSAQIDANRALVEYQTQQQRLTTLQNDLTVQKINLSRLIGLQPDASFELADSVPYTAPPTLSYDEAVKVAMEGRSDLKSADASLYAAQRNHAAARSERLPSLTVSGDYGVTGVNPSQSHGTFNVTGTLRVPIWQGGKTEGDIEMAHAALNQRRAEQSQTRGQIQSDVRLALLNLNAATTQVQVAESNRKVAKENLELTRQRLESGIADSVEVTQAQETVATAELDYITSLLAHNLAKLSLARALGGAEDKLTAYLAVP